jgi:hypothetical protein
MGSAPSAPEAALGAHCPQADIRRGLKYRRQSDELFAARIEVGSIATPNSFKSSAVQLGRTASSISFSRNAASLFEAKAPQPTPDVHNGALTPSARDHRSG